MQKIILAALLVVASLIAVMADSATEVAKALSAILSAGPRGKSNVGASSAWKKLAERDAASLLPLLQEMGGANDHALNWLRAAIDSIAARELKAGGARPIADLGIFMLNTPHHLQARKLAFDLIARLNDATAEKLLPGMLNGLSMELRRDAVEQVVTYVMDPTKPEGEVVSKLSLAEKFLSLLAIAKGAIYLRGNTRLWKFCKSGDSC